MTCFLFFQQKQWVPPEGEKVDDNWDLRSNHRVGTKGKGLSRGKAMRRPRRDALLSHVIRREATCLGDVRLRFLLKPPGRQAGRWLVGRSVCRSSNSVFIPHRERGPPNQFQLESGIFAGQPCLAERLLAVSLTTTRSPLTRLGRKSSTGPYSKAV